MLYPKVDSKQNFPKLEEKILAFWQKNSLFQQSLDKNKDGANNHYVFFDGPPFANGLPHYGHLFTGYVKDLIPRYQTMQGKYVDRRFGWDCHGLPAEMDAEKRLGISGRAAIISHGISEFNAACELGIFKYTKEWETYVNRQARWVDFERDYKTMDIKFMESVIWAFSELYRKGLIYEGYKVMPYSWAVETPLSNFETRLDNSYRMRQDSAVSVAFELEPVGSDAIRTCLIAWTTTPWTLPSNLALAVGKEIEYAILEKEGTHYILGKNSVEKYTALLGNTIVGELRGEDLVGRKYKPLFDYFSDAKNAFQVLSGSFVSDADGTGIVHLAPAFGEDDFALCAQYDIEPICPIDSRAVFTSAVSDYQGLQVFEAIKPIIRDLKDKGLLVKQETIDHNYPHCWRTDTPLIFKIQKSWYVNVTSFKNRMVELNRGVNWIPFHVRDGSFGNWLEGARDWSISRNRFWGTPIPIWQSDNPKYPRIDVYGSIEALEKDFGVKLDNLHRPFIDALIRPNPDDPTGLSTMRRIEDVFDCWFESGSMSFAQNHYPFENKENFEQIFPADFIVEYVAQTRGWFYTMMVLSTALFDKAPFKNAICHGVILAEDGEKLSKSKRNYPDPLDVFNSQGSDALRWFLMSSPLMRGGDLQIDREGRGIAEAARKMIIPFWNAYSFFCLYANADGIKGKISMNSENLLDTYILAKTSELRNEVTECLENYDVIKACTTFEQYIDILNNWYIRRSRERFWLTELTDDKVNAFNTLYTVLTTVSRLVAPFLPYISEEIYQQLTKDYSVHLTDWVKENELPRDERLVNEMDLVIQVCSAALSVRKKHDLRVRQPLSKLIIGVEGFEIDLFRYKNIIANEINVKDVEFTNDVVKYAYKEVVLDSKKLGPLLGQKFKEIMALVKSGRWEKDDTGNLLVGGVVINQSDYTMRLVPKGDIAAKNLDSIMGLVVLDTKIDEALWEEGIVRDFVRLLQNTRKTLDLQITDQIMVKVKSNDQFIGIVNANADYITSQTLSKLDMYNAEGSSMLNFTTSEIIDIFNVDLIVEMVNGPRI